MDIEILVLGRNERLFDQIGNVFGGGEQTAFDSEFINDPAFAGINPTDRLWLILRQAFMAGQVFAIDPKDRTDAKRDNSRAKRHKREKSAKNGKDESDQRGPL